MPMTGDVCGNVKDVPTRRISVQVPALYKKMRSVLPAGILAVNSISSRFGLRDAAESKRSMFKMNANVEDAVKPLGTAMPRVENEDMTGSSTELMANLLLWPQFLTVSVTAVAGHVNWTAVVEESTLVK